MKPFFREKWLISGVRYFCLAQLPCRLHSHCTWVGKKPKLCGLSFSCSKTMGACEVQNLVLKIFTRFSKLTRSNVLLLLSILQWDAHGFYSPDLKYGTQSTSEEIKMPAFRMRPCKTLFLRLNKYGIKRFAFKIQSYTCTMNRVAWVGVAV